MCSSICANLAARTLPTGYTVDYAGPSRQFVQESTGVMSHLRLRHHRRVPDVGRPLRKLSAIRWSFIISVPLSIAGALIFIASGGARSIAQYLHPGRPGHIDRPDQQARHSHRRSRERGAAERQVEARRDRCCGRRAAAADSHDHRGDGFRCDSLWCLRRGPGAPRALRSVWSSPPASESARCSPCLSYLPFTS